MKKLLIFLFAACLAITSVCVLASCKKDETAAETADAPITFSYSIVKDDGDTYYSLKNVTVSDKAQKLIAKKDYSALAKLFNAVAGDYKPERKYTKDTVTALVIPSEYKGIAVKAIGQDAVSGLAFVKKIVVGDNIEKISEGAFSSLTSLEEIELPFVGGEKNGKNEKKLFGYIFGTTSGDGLTACEQKFNGGDSGNTKTYYVPTSLKTVTVRGGNEKKTVEKKYKIERKDGEDKYIFEGETGYDELNADENKIEFNEDVYSVAPYSFYNCSTVERVNLNVDEIEEYTFYGCSGILSITFDSAIKTIGAHAYENCTSLKTVNFNKVEKIGEYAFAGCTALGEDYIDGENKIVIAAEVGDNAFEGCTALKTVEFKTGAKIGVRAFKGCTSIKEIDLTNVTALGDYAFYGCTKLELENVINPNELSANHAFDETNLSE